MTVHEDRILLRVAAAARAMDVSRSKLYVLINQAQVPHVRIGGSLRIPVQALRAWIEQKIDAKGEEI
jgi:excisionase family DNA binding protein